MKEYDVRDTAIYSIIIRHCTIKEADTICQNLFYAIELIETANRDEDTAKYKEEAINDLQEFINTLNEN